MSYQNINFLIDSSKRQNASDGTTDFSCSLSNALKVRSCRLRECCVPLTFYNITSDNNHLEYNVDWATPSYFTFDIPPGRYTPVSLVSVVMEHFNTTNNALEGSYQMSYSDVTGKFTVVLTPGTVGEPTFLMGGTLMAWLGFTELLLSHSYQISNSSPHGFITNDYLKLNLTYLDGGVLEVNNERHSATFIVENTIDFTEDYFGKKLFIQNPDADTGVKSHEFQEPITLQQFHISIRNSANEVLDLNGANWWAVVELHVETDTHPMTEYITNVLSKYATPIKRVGTTIPPWLHLS